MANTHQLSAKTAGDTMRVEERESEDVHGLSLCASVRVLCLRNVRWTTKQYILFSLTTEGPRSETICENTYFVLLKNIENISQLIILPVKPTFELHLPFEQKP